MIDEYSPVWLEVKKYAERRVEELKDDLCSTFIDDDKTQQIRGKVLALREILDLPSKTKGA